MQFFPTLEHIGTNWPFYDSTQLHIVQKLELYRNKLVIPKNGAVSRLAATQILLIPTVIDGHRYEVGTID